MSWENEINEKKRFEFGENWNNFLNSLTEEQINSSKQELQKWFDCDTLEGKSFLDIGSGSGLHSLAARMLGANVYSIDYDINSVKCTEKLKEMYFKDDINWQIKQGSVLDAAFLNSLGKFDIVYSWGVLHHTGSMHQALENVIIPLKEDEGKLFIAIYNTQLTTSSWKRIKKFYVSSNIFVKKAMTYIYLLYFGIGSLFIDTLRWKNPLKRYDDQRGMKFYYDVVDWIGGYPFETAKPEEIFDFYKIKNFHLDKMKTVGGKMGCNEYLFVRA